MLQCKWLKSLAIYWIKVRELWVVCVRVLRHFSVFPCIHAPIFPINYKKLQNVFNVVTKQRQTETQNALCNFSKLPHMCKLLIIWLGALCGLCILPYIHGLRLALVCVAYQAVLYSLGLYGR